MRSLSEHALVLGNALFAIHESDELSDVYTYLTMAAGVRGVQFDTGVLGGHPEMCSDAAEMGYQQDRLWGIFTHRLTVFSFTWAAVEAYEDYLRKGIREPLYPGNIDVAPSDPRHNIQLVDAAAGLGKKSRQIEKLCYYLSQRFTDPYPAEYHELLNAFKAAAAEAQMGRGAAVDRKLPAYMQPVAEGLYLAYEFRNAFAHGDFSAPEPDDDADPDPDPEMHPDIVVVELATRVLLFTLQMMTLCIFEGDAAIEAVHLEVYGGDAECLSLRDVFLNLHLENIDHLAESEE